MKAAVENFILGLTEQWTENEIIRDSVMSNAFDFRRIE